MLDFDWRSPEAYTKMQTAEAADFAWECLRRNSDYQNEFRSLPNDGPLAAVSDEFRQRWGLTFRS
jgi:hypothetical protein